MTSETPAVWVLRDDRAGHNAQSHGLAHNLGMFYSIKPIKYRKLASLPNFLVGSGLVTLKKDSQELIAPPWPQLVIAAGRRTIPVVQYIKEHSPETLLVQLMWPGQIDPFDLVIAPKHDLVPKDPRVISTTGALHSVTENDLKHEAKDLQERFLKYPKPHIALMIGGKSKHGNFKQEDFQTMLDLAELMVNREKGSLLISTSRRTPSYVIGLIKERLTCPYYLYHYGSDESNPYPGILGLADGIIVSGDSISMAAEACFTGKPVFIYAPPRLKSSKIRIFTKQLFDGGYARALSAESTLDFIPEQRLDEMGRVIDIVKKKLTGK